ncbi:MAG: penicillin-binding protein [Bacteroidota bacterium]
MAGNLIKNEVLVRVYAILGLLVIAGVAIFTKAVKISAKEGEQWRYIGQQYIKKKPLAAERGNIITEGGEFLATSVPVFDIAFDPNSRGLSEEDFFASIDSLSYHLANHLDETFTPGGLRDYLVQKRKEGRKYVVIKRGVSFSEKERMATYPLFERGQFGGGFIAEPKYRRERPYGVLARRTIGYVRATANPVGLEGFYDEDLSGERGERLMQLVDPAEELWIPASDFNTIEPKRGNDIVTTIDLELQDITENALSRAMNYHDPDWGTAIVMEVKTGKIKAIANLGRTDEGWWETYNYGVGQAIEPGSVFKLASMMALLEDDYVDLDDSIALYKGKIEYYEDVMEDSYPHSMDSTTVRRAFEISSNVGISSMVNEYYNQTKAPSGKPVRKAGEFIDHLKEFKLHLPTAVEIDGEAKPYIKEAYNTEDYWSGTTLPWMSIGYEITLTPLQMLSFYNTVANNGRMMKPYLVSEVQHLGETKETFKPRIIDQSIASRKTIAQVQELLEGVVERGTAKKLYTDRYSFAGKTGTAQINYQRLKNRTYVGGYQASFAGYFPAEKPLYSCIVVVNRPRQNGYYGGDVAGPVFREIADKAFASKIDLHAPVNETKAQFAARKLPNKSIGESSDMEYLMEHFDMTHDGKSGTEWSVLDATESDTIIVRTRRMKSKQVPNVVGLGLRDALYALENQGIKVKTQGVGKVYKQSLKVGTSVGNEGRTITIYLR